MTTEEISERFEAIIFDLDGVITHTANLHYEAWKQLFDEFLQKQESEESPFSRQDYEDHVDGKPRYEGVAAFLKSRSIELPWGDEEDAPGWDSIYALGNLKNDFFHQQMEENGVETYDDTLACIQDWKTAHKKMAVVSSSKNCRLVLERAGLIDTFDAIFDGKDAQKEKVKGKPEPDIFLKAAQQLQVSPGAAVVFEDAIAGVEAGKKGNFGLVIGVDRGGQEQDMKQAGADLVIGSLEALINKKS